MADSDASANTSRQSSRMQPNVQHLLVDKGLAVARTAVRGGTAIGLAYFGVKAIQALSGKQTNAHIVIDAIASVGREKWPNYAVMAVLILWALAERKLRKRSIRRWSGRIASLESSIDPDRTSSGLDKFGDTHPGDRV